MSGMQSSLARHIPSGFTDDQANDSREQYERRAWLDRGIILIGIDDQDIPWPLRELAGQYGVRRFKCRPGKASWYRRAHGNYRRLMGKWLRLVSA